MFNRFIKTKTLRLSGRLLGGLLVLAVLGAFLPQSSALAAVDAACQDTYTVKSGDYLSKIAALYDGVSWLDIAEANDLKSPYVLTVGQKLCIPARAGSGSSGGSGTSTGGSSRITVKKSSGKLTVTVSNLQSKATYFVKLDDADKRAYEWFKVGVLRTGSDKAGDGTYTLPDELKKTTDFNVCLKNTANDDLFCNNAALSRVGEDDDDDDRSSKKGSFTVTRLSDRIVINTSRFPEDSFYNVKVAKTGKAAPTYYKIGVLRTGDDSSGRYTYELPEQLEDADNLTVCLKNLKTDDVNCVLSSR